MSEDTKAEDFFSAFKKYVPFFSAYCICISGLFLWGFWSTFDVNIFQYIDIGGIVKTAALPLLVAGSGLLIFFSLGYFIHPRESKILLLSSPLSEDLRVLDKRFQSIESNYKRLLICWIFITVLVWIYPFAWKWDVVSFLMAVPVTILLNESNFANNIFRNGVVRTTLIMFLVFFVPFSFSFGLKESLNIKEGNNFNYIVSIGDAGHPSIVKDPKKTLRYVAQVNEFSFFYDPANDVVSIFKLKPGEAISFKNYKNPNTRINRIRVTVEGFFTAITKYFSDVLKT